MIPQTLPKKVLGSIGMASWHGFYWYSHWYSTDVTSQFFKFEVFKKIAPPSLRCFQVLGGSSSLNGLLYVRGLQRDYDTWAAAGNEGWSYRELLPFFRSCEDAPYDEEHRWFFWVDFGWRKWWFQTCLAIWIVGDIPWNLGLKNRLYIWNHSSMDFGFMEDLWKIYGGTWNGQWWKGWIYVPWRILQGGAPVR